MSAAVSPFSRTPLTPDPGTPDLGVKQVADQLHEALLRYIEAQYHVRDTDVIEERRRLLRESGTIGQEAYIETTPAYVIGDPYMALGLPSPVGETLAEIASFDIGIFAKPYVHQAQALKSFFADTKDLVVATGTGSGKTESFLMPILGAMLLEAAHRPTWHAPGLRAIILYPMNALVSDQLTRLRRLFGDARVAALFRERYGRHPRFGMYTSRTPYPGVRTSRKDQDRVAPILHYYLGLEQTAALEPDPKKRARAAALVEELKARGRWPAKDLQHFFGTPNQRWETRLETAAGDRELLTRQEVQQHCPDLLVTNYSMLEYMLLRPIERSLFRKTREWLAADRRNQLTLVIDEAHMYRGVGGAEVALLIRRLQARLGIAREQLRCILTSASLGEGPEAEATGHTFAVGLTGATSSGTSPFRVIQGTKVVRPHDRAGTAVEAAELASLDLQAFFKRTEDLGTATEAVGRFAAAMTWPTLPRLAQVAPGTTPPAGAEAALRHYLFTQLESFGPMARLINTTAGNATALSALVARLFPGVDNATGERATDALLALGTYAHNNDRPLLPTRAHLFFRGLPTLYACIDPNCTARRHARAGPEPYLIGRLYTEPRTHCTCASRARVYELYAHRDCGAVFLRVFGRGHQATFYWHEQGGTLETGAEPFDEALLILEPPHHEMLDRVEPIWVELTTGRVETAPPSDPSHYRVCWRARAGIETSLIKRTRPRKRRKNTTATTTGDPEAESKGPLTTCPNCTRRTGHKIMDLETKGEQPFANLVREQLVLQPVVKPISEHYPNGGRKVLLFSDGRQKAARLARDLPREVEFDSFRQALVLAIHLLERERWKVALDDRLYRAFVTVCADFHLHFFDQEGNSQAHLLHDIQQYQERYADLRTLLEEGQGVTPPARFRQALLRQVADPFYSLYSACAAVVEPTESAMRAMDRALSTLPEAFRREHLRAYAAMWIQTLLDRGAFDPGISEIARREVNEYFRPWEPGQKVPRLERLAEEHGELTQTQVTLLRDVLYKTLTRPDAKNNPYLSPSEVTMRVVMDDPWLQCRACGLVQHTAVLGRCAWCGAPDFAVRLPDDPYMTSRKGYFREPLRAVLAGGRPLHVTAEEHTAQLSQRDKGVVYATTEEYELRFQDVLIDVDRPPVDVLSCTTTMEVGIDIGSLTAVGLRNVPPQRENYQQRAGRSGRRSSAVSTVITYTQNGPHDYHYYSHPDGIISGPPRAPKLKVDNRRLAVRHVHSYLIQTFFHETLDRLGQDDEAQIAAERTHIMSAFGPAADFFGGTGDFSLPSFRRWIEAQVTTPSAPLAERIAAWLPDAIVSTSATPPATQAADKAAFVRAVAEAFLATLQARVPTYGGGDAAGTTGAPTGEDEDYGMLLDVLFDEGLLPSYAFPTDLCPFYVYGWEKGQPGIKEMPQQGKDKALSEYAPGRLLVIDKQTFRVGGIIPTGPRPPHPGQALFANALPVYVFCPRCTYVEVREDPHEPPQICPVCHAALEERLMLDPPAFVPEKGEPLHEHDRSQEISFATEAQFPTPVNLDLFEWRPGPGPILQSAYAENQTLVIANKGPKLQGFRVCQTCGAAWPDAETPPSGRHLRPYPLQTWDRKAGITRDCAGPITADPLYLGYQFRTDILLLQVPLRAPIAYGARDPWLHDAVRTTTEALALAASRRLDVDPGELSAGYRLMPPTRAVPGTLATVELYLYDTAAGGAGYAAEAGEQLEAVLRDALALLRGCPEQCERSCTKCLRHYGNRFWHERLDRRLAAAFLDYALDDTFPAIPDTATQGECLAALERYLELEGWTTTRGSTLQGEIIPLIAERAGRRAAVGVYPALLAEAAAWAAHPVARVTSEFGTGAVLLNEYVVLRDLPTTARQFARLLGI